MSHDRIFIAHTTLLGRSASGDRDLVGLDWVDVAVFIMNTATLPLSVSSQHLALKWAHLALTTIRAGFDPARLERIWVSIRVCKKGSSVRHVLIC